MYTLRFNLGKADLVIIHIMADVKPFKLYLINIYIDRCYCQIFGRCYSQLLCEMMLQLTFDVDNWQMLLP